MTNNLSRINIVAISASPSKGRNSDTMLDHFILGIKKERKDIIIEKFYTEDIYYDYYNYENKEGATANEKEFAALAEKMRKADGIIIATPTYNFSVPAKLKNLIDRIRFIALDLDKKNIFGQPVGKFKKNKMFFLVSGGTPNWLHWFLFFLFPDFWLTIIFAYFGSFRSGTFYSGDINTFKKDKILKKCFKKGQKFSNKF